MDNYHVPVLLQTTISSLVNKPKGIFIDCTLGGGGHFREILNSIEEGIVIGIDADTDAINVNRNRLDDMGFVIKHEDGEVIVFEKDLKTAVIVHDNFKNLSEIFQTVCKILNRNDKADGILFDLGVSSFQIDSGEKGFSYMKNGPLDMRMDKRLTVKAEDLVNGMYEKELENLLRIYGEEQFASRIAKSIVKERKIERITTSGRLNEVIKKSVPFFYKNPLAKTYQALRIAVNGELDSLQKALTKVDVVLNDGGKVAIISFHSLEDRIVKKYFAENENFKKSTETLQATVEEIDQNKRARSAKLRVYEKTAHDKN